MPSVTDVQQQSTPVYGKSTPPPPALADAATANLDGITQSILVLEKKQRNLGKRKEKLESYEAEAKTGKELHKDQKEALAKYPEVLGQIEGVKELLEQLKKIQIECNKNQKRLAKQAAEEKRLQISQRLNEYAQIRYLLDHRPKNLKPEDSSLLDELSRLIVPSDGSASSISRSVDTVLSIYQGGPSVNTLKTLTGKTTQELRESLEHLIKDLHKPSTNEQPTTTTIVHEEQQEEEEELPLPPQPEEKKPEEIQQQPTTSEPEEVAAPSRSHFSEYPLQFDTRNQNIPLEQIFEDGTFLSDGFTESTPRPQNDLPSEPPQQQQQQLTEDNWQQTRPNANNQRNNRNFQSRGGYNNSYYPSQQQQQQQQTQQGYRGSRGGRYDGGAYSAGAQRPYYDNANRGRGAPNPNYRGSRGGNYRGGYRGNGNGNGSAYPKSNVDQQ